MIISMISKVTFLQAGLIRLFLKLETFCRSTLDALLIRANRGIHPKHELMRYHDFFLTRIKPGDAVLDVGCGIGIVSYSLAQKAGSVVGLDLNQDNIAQAEKRFLLPNINYVCADFSAYHNDRRFDAVVLSNVLEHVSNRKLFLEHAAVFAPLLLIRVPMLNRDWIPLYRASIGLSPFSDKSHFVEYTLDSFNLEMKAAGLRIECHSIQFGEIWAVVLKG